MSHRPVKLNQTVILSKNFSVKAKSQCFSGVTDSRMDQCSHHHTDGRRSTVSGLGVLQTHPDVFTSPHQRTLLRLTLGGAVLGFT